MKHVLTRLVTVVALVSLAAVGGRADSSEMRNRLTFNRPVALPGVTLPAGTYLFERPIPGAINLVRVTDERTLRTIYTGFTQMVSRPDTLRQTIVLGEAPIGEPTRLAVWFPIGQPEGHRFIF